MIAAIEPTSTWYLILAALLFCVGMVGVMVRRNPLVMFMCIELMLNAVNLSFVALARSLGDIGGQTNRALTWNKVPHGACSCIGTATSAPGFCGPTGRNGIMQDDTRHTVRRAKSVFMRLHMITSFPRMRIRCFCHEAGRFVQITHKSLCAAT